MNNLPEDVKVKSSTLFCDNIYAKNKNIPQLVLPKFRGKRRAFECINRFGSIKSLIKNDFDVFHPTYYNPYFLNKLKKPYVITVHDMIHEKFYDSINDKRIIELKRQSITNASKIIAISENTKKDVMEIYDIAEEKINVVYHGYSVGMSYSEKIEDLPPKYILYVGVRAAYKNFHRFLEAFALINKNHNDIELVCTGSPFTEEEISLITKLGLKNKVKRYFVSDGQLTYLYQHALCFVFPSLYEGFGIPILEAFAAKCPIALSNTSCFPEIARDGGAYFDPLDYSSIAKTVDEILNNESYRANLIGRGSAVLSNYSWKKMGEQTAEVYKSLV